MLAIARKGKVRRAERGGADGEKARVGSGGSILRESRESEMGGPSELWVIGGFGGGVSGDENKRLGVMGKW